MQNCSRVLVTSRQPKMAPNHRLEEGCYGWLIVVMVFMNHLLIYGIANSIGVFYQMFR